MTALARQSWLQAGRGLRRAARTPPVLVQTLFFPGLLLFVLLAVFGELVAGATDQDHVQGLVPLMVVTGAMFGGLGTGAALVTEREEGLLDRFRVMPVHRGSVLAGRVLAEVGRVLLASVVLVGLGHAAGFRFQAGVPSAVGFFVVVAAVAVAFAWVVMAVAIRARTPEAVVALTPLLLLLMFLNSGFVPREAFPGFLQPVVGLSPVSCAVQAMLGLSAGGPVLVPVLQTAGWLLALSVVFGVVAVRGFSRSR